MCHYHPVENSVLKCQHLMVTAYRDNEKIFWKMSFFRKCSRT